MTATPPTKTPSVSHPAHTLLSRAHSPTHSTAIFTDKIKNKPLLLHPTTDPSNRRALRRQIRAHKQRYHLQHRKPRPLSAREKRRLQLHTLDPSEVRYDVYRGLNRMWNGYILEVLGFTRDGSAVADAEKRSVTPAGQGSLLCSADFHGMEVEVARCRDVGKVGLRGIVVRETKGTLVVVTAQNQTRTILKSGAVFKVTVALPGAGEEGQERRLVFELHGDQLQIRPVERAVRKFKWKLMDYL